jgi:hypothetical protein
VVIPLGNGEKEKRGKGEGEKRGKGAGAVPLFPSSPLPLFSSSRIQAAIALAPLAAGLLLLCAVIVFGGLALRALHGQARYQIAFADIDCAAPPHVSRAEFLEEVQYFARMPDSVCVLDDGLPARLSAAFARHPWVEEVKGVEITAPSRVRVQLVYRIAALTVALGDGIDRPVDRHGVRLPVAAVDPSVPVLRGDVRPPAGQEGQLWGDERVAAAARTAWLLAPYQDRLHLQTFVAAPDDLILSGAPYRVLWGAAPGGEPLGEAAAEVKVRRLLDFTARHGAGQWEVDLRPEGEAAVRPLN